MILNSTFPGQVDAKLTKQTGLLILFVSLVFIAALALLGGVKVAVVAIASMAAVVSLARPNFAVPLFAFLLFTNAPVVASRFHGLPSILVAAVAGLLLIPLVHQIVVLKKPLIIVPTLPVIGLFVAFRLLAILWSDERDLAFSSALATIIEGLLMYILLTNVIRTPEMLRHVIWATLLAGTVMGSLSTYQQLTGRMDQNFGGFAQTSLDSQILTLDAAKKDARTAGPIGEKNYYAQFMLLLVPLAFGQFRGAQTRWARLVSLGMGLLILLGIATTASRGAAIGFIVLVLTIVILREIQLRQFLLVVAVSVVLLMLVPAFQTRIYSMISAAGSLPGSGQIQTIEKSLQGRVSEMWAAAVIFSEHPIGGVGPGNFPVHFLKNAGSLGFQVHAEQRMAHCSYLEIAAETGIVGLLLYLGIYAVTLRELWYSRQWATCSMARDQATAFLLMVIVMMATGLFLSLAFERYYWFMLALAAVAAATARSADERRIPSPIGQPSVVDAICEQPSSRASS